MPRPDWIFLDAGNTLVHLDMGRVSDILHAEFGRRIDPAAMEAAEPGARIHVDGTGLDPDGERARWRTYFWAVLSAGGWPDQATVADAIRALFQQNQIFSLWSRPARAAVETLQALRDAGFKLAVISNSDGSVEGMLERLGLKRHLEFVLDSKVVGVEKPDPRIFRMALDRSGADPSKSVYVGDMFHIDVVGARGVGMEAILVDPAGLFGTRDCHRIGEISELADRLW